MLQTIKLNTNWECFFKKTTFNFEPVTLLVGDQGCGKSTLLRIISLHSQDKVSDDSLDVTMSEDNKLESFRLFDLEKDNPRTSNKATPGSIEALAPSMQSHGEAILPVFDHVMDAKNALILLDEPETSLSLRSQYRFIEQVKLAVANGCQVIMATHSKLFMEAFKVDVYSLEHLKYMKLENFVRAQKRSSNFKEKRNHKMIKQTHCSMGNDCTCANTTGWYNRSCENHVQYRPMGGRRRK